MVSSFCGFVRILSVLICMYLHLYVFLVIFPCFFFLFGFVIFHFFNSFYFLWLSSKCFLYSNEKWKDTDVGGKGSGEDLGGVGEGETIIRIYCMKKSAFSTKSRERTPHSKWASKQRPCAKPYQKGQYTVRNTGGGNLKLRRGKQRSHDQKQFPAQGTLQTSADSPGSQTLPVRLSDLQCQNKLEITV